jgi:hypothetical protein
MAKTLKNSSSKEAKQARTIQSLKEKENWMKWGLVAALIIILLLLLFIGYATDWTRGIKTTSSTTPLSANLDSGKTADTGTSGTNGNSTSGNSGTNGQSGNSGSRGQNGLNGSNGTNGTNGGTTNNSTTTNNTTNNTTTNPPAKAPTTAYDALLEIYNSTGVGANLKEVVDKAVANGISATCTDDLLLRSCTLTAGGLTVTLRGLLSTGLLTSIIRL